MGTNYYWCKGICESCGKSDTRLHIGKSSLGWCFQLHVSHPDEKGLLPSSLEGWISLFGVEDSQILTEFGDAIAPAEMVHTITVRNFMRDWEKDAPEGYDSWDEWLEDNSVTKGPYNLTRFIAGAENCIGWGAGTWDLLTGEFE